MEEQTPSDAEREEGAVTYDEAVQIALDMLRKREVKAAVGILENVLEYEPEHIDALHYLGVARFHLDGAEKSIEILKRAVEVAPGQATIRNNLGNSYVEIGDMDNAVAQYDKAIELDPNLADPYSNLASIVKYAGNIGFAEKLLRKAIDINPEFGVAHQNLAWILLDNGRAKEAIDYFWKATVYLPNKAVPAHFLALAYWFAGLKDLAIDFVKKFADANPDDVQAQHMRASMTGENVPDRASESYVSKLFDNFASSFDSKLESLEYRAPELVGKAVTKAVGENASGLVILDAGCGTGKCAKYLKPHAATLHGVDLSAGMLTKAKKLNLYDGLAKGELTAFLLSQPGEYDVVASADTLCYFGRLEEFAASAIQSVKPGGVLIFTVEKMMEPIESYKLSVNGRYTHNPGYALGSLTDAGFAIDSCEEEKLRMENGEPVVGLLITARRPLEN